MDDATELEEKDRLLFYVGLVEIFSSGRED